MIHPFGEAAALVELDAPEEGQALAASLTRERPPWLLGAVPGLQSLLVEFDPLRIGAQEVGRTVLERLASLDTATIADRRIRHIPVAYGSDFGPDLDEVAQLTGQSPDDVIRLHAGAELRVLFGGFAPGFAYLGDLPDEMRVPRLATPRTRTPSGSVAIAGSMSGVYPADLPGGWRVIGRTPLQLFDPRREPPAYLVPGDRVRFEPIAEAEWDRFAGPAGDW